jgi:hypothetical protein
VAVCGGEVRDFGLEEGERGCEVRGRRVHVAALL